MRRSSFCFPLATDAACCVWMAWFLFAAKVSGPALGSRAVCLVCLLFAVLLVVIMGAIGSSADVTCLHRHFWFVCDDGAFQGLVALAIFSLDCISAIVVLVACLCGQMSMFVAWSLPPVSVPLASSSTQLSLCFLFRSYLCDGEVCWGRVAPCFTLWLHCSWCRALVLPLCFGAFLRGDLEPLRPVCLSLFLPCSIGLTYGTTLFLFYLMSLLSYML